jgi:SPASM domain peptide maturase of grasp-with-spasm system
MKDTYFKLYSCCIPVMGKTGAVIIDLQKVSYTTIPQFLCELLQDYENENLDTLAELYEDRDNSIRQYLDHLCDKHLGFFTDEPERYPKMSLNWDTPEIVKLAVIEIEDYSRFNYKEILQQLDQLLCKNMEIWFTGSYTRANIEDLLSATHGTVLRSLALILPYNTGVTIKGYEELTALHTKIGQIYLYAAPEIIKSPDTRVYAITDDIDDLKKMLTNIPRDQYIIFLEFFTENRKYNAYYNKKICIDTNGYVKNCLTHRRDFGNIAEKRLEQIVEDPAFRELWHACNERVLDIKDSEFRDIWLNTYDLEKVDDNYYRMVEQ